MIKLYHVLHTKKEDKESSVIVSSWSTHAQAVLAARHFVIDQTPQSSWSYQEDDEKDEFAITFSEPPTDVRTLRPAGDAGEVTIKHSIEPEKTASKDKLEPLLWGVFLRHRWHPRRNREMLIGDTFYPSLQQANTIARKDAWAILKEFCGCVESLEERTGIKEDPTGKHHFGQHGPDEKNKRSESRCYSVLTDWLLDDTEQDFLLHVRPVRLAKEPSLKEKRKREDDDSRGSSPKKTREEADSSSRESTPEWAEPENDGYTYYG